MNLRILASMFVLLLIAPGTASAAPTAEYPEDFIALLPGWIATSEALVTEADRERPWWNETETFLARAKSTAAEGRVRVTLFHLETYEELLVGNRLIDAGVAMGNDAEAKSMVLRRTSGWDEDVERAWEAYRAKLHAYDGQLHSLVTLEKALYSADVALTGVMNEGNFEYLSRELPKQEGFPSNYVFALVRATNTPLTNLRWASDMLDAATKSEGTPPRVVDEKWANVTATAIAYGNDEAPPAYLEAIDARGRPVRANEEGMLAVVFVLAEQRALRANAMETIFGDARTRGLDVVRDAARGMVKQLNNTTMDLPRSYGLVGIFTADAIDRARLTRDYVDADDAELGTVIIAWAQLEHQGYALSALGGVSPVTPPPVEPDTKGTPLPGALALLGIAAIVAVLVRRRA